VVVVADRDEPGYRHARAVLTSLTARGDVASVRVVEPATTGEHDDVSDHLDAGHTIDQLVPLDPDELARRAGLPSGVDGTDTASDRPGGASLLDRYPERSRDGLGNRDRLADHYGHELRYLADAEAWAYYDGVGWSTEGAKAAVLSRAQRTIEALPDTEARHYSGVTGARHEGEPDPTSKKDDFDETSPRARFLRWVGGQRYHGKQMEMIAAATGLDSLRATRAEFERHPWLVNVGNGVLDLRADEVGSHDPALMLMHRTATPYHPDAGCSRWTRLLERLQPDQEMRDYLRRVCGYTLTGHTSERAVFVHHGEAQDARRAFTRVLKAVMGTYAQTVPRATLTIARAGRGSIPIDVARMAGVRLLAPEAIPDGMLDETVVLALADGDDHSARNLREQFTDFTPVGKLHLAARWMPTTQDGLTLGSYLHGIAWDLSLPGSEAQDAAEQIIATELPGVLAWAVRGCLEWQRGGLQVPKSARDRTEDVVFHDDPVAQWLALRTEPTAADRCTTLGELFADWASWAAGGEIAPGEHNALSRRLGKFGYRRDRAKDKNRGAVVFGIALRADRGSVPWE